MSSGISTIINKYIFLLVVFITGAAILILEVVATRVLSVYFGNTIFTVSSVISVILLALSIGYYVGGRLSDKKASASLFYSLILISGYLVLIIYLLNLFVIPELSYNLSFREGPLVISMLLFFLPAFLLGTLSPLVVTLQNKKKKEGIGRTTGDVYFWSTLGSILGSLGSGFYLIPNFGIDKIIVGVGVILIAIAVIGLRSTRKTAFISGLFIFTLVVFPVLYVTVYFFSRNFKNNSVLYSRDGLYSKITIYDDIYGGEKARFLKQDLDLSSGMYLDSDDLVFNYAKYYKLKELTHTGIRNALVIGGGAYTVPNALLNDDRHTRVDVAEIEPHLFEIVKKYFRIQDDTRLNNYIEDGRRFLHGTEKSYDLIYVDAFNFSVPSHLTTFEFFQLSKNKLSPEGLFVMNIIGRLTEKSPSFLLSEIRTFKKAFPNSYFFAVNSLEQKTEQNIMFVGYNSEERMDFKQPQFLTDEFLRSLAYLLIDTGKFDLSAHRIFTDNYSPVEYYISRRIGEL